MEVHLTLWKTQQSFSNINFVPDTSITFKKLLKMSANCMFHLYSKQPRNSKTLHIDRCCFPYQSQLLIGLRVMKQKENIVKSFQNLYIPVDRLCKWKRKTTPSVLIGEEGTKAYRIIEFQCGPSGFLLFSGNLKCSITSSWFGLLFTIAYAKKVSDDVEFHSEKVKRFPVLY